MVQLTSMMGTVRTPDGRKLKLLSLADIDGRTNAAKAVRRIMADLESDLGGPDAVSAAQRILIGRAAVAGAMVEHLEASWLSGGDYDEWAYAALVKLQIRLLTTLGLERKMVDVTPNKPTTIRVIRSIVDPGKPGEGPKQSSTAYEWSKIAGVGWRQEQLQMTDDGEIVEPSPRTTQDPMTIDAEPLRAPANHSAPPFKSIQVVDVIVDPAAAESVDLADVVASVNDSVAPELPPCPVPLPAQ
jgi:hypothetical protein